MLGKSKVYTADKDAVGRGSGVYSAQEMSHLRGLHEPFMQARDMRSYRLSMYSDLAKTSSAIEFLKLETLGQFSKLGDIGGSPFFQARVILDAYPHLTATLTDYDEESVSAIADIGIFNGHTLTGLDASAGDFSALNGCDLLTMWGVDFALTDEALVQLFRYVARSKATLYMAMIYAPSARIISKAAKSAVYDTFGEAKFGRRFMGWLRSERYMTSLVREGWCDTIRTIRFSGYEMLVIKAVTAAN